MTDTADKNKLGYIGKVPGSRDSDSWFTPAGYIKQVRLVLKTITLDPFTSKEANTIIQADNIITAKQNAFTMDWPHADTVFMNPPYGAIICGQACDRFLHFFDAGKIGKAIVLTNNATETKWAQRLLSKASAVCFPDHRISFWNADGKAVSGNTRGQMFTAFGPIRAEFKTHFKRLGVVL